MSSGPLGHKQIRSWAFGPRCEPLNYVSISTGTRSSTGSRGATNLDLQFDVGNFNVAVAMEPHQNFIVNLSRIKTSKGITKSRMPMGHV